MVSALPYSRDGVVQHRTVGVDEMAKTQRKPKTPAKMIRMPKSDYQPSSEEKKQEVDIPVEL